MQSDRSDFIAIACRAWRLMHQNLPFTVAHNAIAAYIAILIPVPNQSDLVM